eukprot:366436-Chlamydomonas_euryale.AAC.6
MTRRRPDRSSWTRKRRGDGRSLPAAAWPCPSDAAAVFFSMSSLESDTAALTSETLSAWLDIPAPWQNSKPRLRVVDSQSVEAHSAHGVRTMQPRCAGAFDHEPTSAIMHLLAEGPVRVTCICRERCAFHFQPPSGQRTFV